MALSKVKEIVASNPVVVFNEIQAALAQWTGQRTVPNVFIGGNHIGGCDTTTAMHKGRELIPLLTQAGAAAKSSFSS